MSEENTGNPVQTDSANTPDISKNVAVRKAALSLIPLSPAPLFGTDSFYGWARLAIYGGLAYATWGKSRKASYIFAGAAGVSLCSSLTANAWVKGA